MRTVGSAEAALAALIYRANNRTAFGKLLSKKDTIRQIIAEARIEITKTRLLCYLAATIADEKVRARAFAVVLAAHPNGLMPATPPPTTTPLPFLPCPARTEQGLRLVPTACRTSNVGTFGDVAVVVIQGRCRRSPHKLPRCRLGVGGCGG